MMQSNSKGDALPDSGPQDGTAELRRPRAYGSPGRQGLVWTLISLAILLVLSIAFLIALGRERPPRTIVLILANGCFYEDFGFAGNAAAWTPTLDGLARAGALFPVTHNTMSLSRLSQRSISTGRILPPAEPAAANPRDEPHSAIDSLPSVLVRHQVLTWSGGRFVERMADPGEFTHGFTRPGHLVLRNDGGLKQFLNGAEGRDVFLWWAPNLPQPLAGPSPEILEKIGTDSIAIPDSVPENEREAWREQKRQTLAMGAWLDNGIADLFLDLDDADRLDNTLVIFMSDAGHAILQPSEGTPYEAGLRTPLIVWKSGNSLGGRTSTALVSSVDVAPTILDWANIEIPDSMEGASLWPLIHDPAAPRRTALFGAISIPPGKRRSAAGNQVYALYVRTDQWKYITYLKDLSHTEARKAGYPTDRGRKGFRRAGEEELYDLSKDPYEEENLAALPEHREQLETLRRNVFEWWRSRDESDLPRLDAKQNDPQPLRTRPNRRNRSQKPKSEEESNE